MFFDNNEGGNVCFDPNYSMEIDFIFFIGMEKLKIKHNKLYLHAIKSKMII